MGASRDELTSGLSRWLILEAPPTGQRQNGVCSFVTNSNPVSRRDSSGPNVAAGERGTPGEPGIALCTRLPGKIAVRRKHRPLILKKDK